MPKRFSLQQFERYDLHSQLIDQACQIAKEEGIISPELLRKFSEGGKEKKSEEIDPENLLYTAQKFHIATGQEKIQWFKKLKDATATLSADEQEQLANLMNLLVPVVHAANSVRQNEQPNSTPEEIFKNYLTAGITARAGGLNHFGMQPDAWLDSINEAKGKLILSLVNTAHPTNFYTPFGRQYEKSLITGLAEAGAVNAGALSQPALTAFTTRVRGACRDMKAGKTMTYLSKVTVGEEAGTEEDVLKVQQRAVANMMGAWNAAILDVKAHAVPSMQKKLSSLALSEEDKKRIYEQRTWIRGGADKDGRDESTDVAFYAGYRDSLDNNGVYKGPILDMRDNAEVRKKTIGALVARAYKNDSNFHRLCDKFCEDRVAKTKKPLGKFWKDAEHSLFQMLSEENQTAFLQCLMDNGINLFNAREQRSETLTFNEAYYNTYQKFLKDRKLDKSTPYWALDDKQRADLIMLMRKVEATIEMGSRENPRQATGGFRFDRVFDGGDNIIGFIYNHAELGSPLTVNQHTVNGHGHMRRLNEAENLSCMAYIRRLFLADKFIDEQKGKAVVAEREQSANFENASDFFAQLYLFQQTGLVKIEEKGEGKAKHKEVTEVKLGIQPLFETTPEMKRAPEIIDQILASPLGESYYRSRGKAEFMVGYSDGAKSGGNFASHMRIREFEKVITEKFKEKFGPDYEVRILRGPGRGENRGGSRKYDRQYRLHHDIVNRSAVSDQTVQGDLIIRMEMDPAFAERTLSEMMVSAMAGSVEAQRPKSDLEKRRIASFEEACHFIADHSERNFRSGIFTKEKEADALIKTVIKNQDASSRRVVRSDTEQKGIGPQRAITVEYASQIAGLPLHDYGLKSALEEYVKNGPPVLDEKGNKVDGKRALEILARDFAFFREEIKLAALRQQNFNPVLASSWAKKAHQEAFVGDIKLELKGLDDMCQSLLSGRKMNAFSREDYAGESFTPAFADIGQAIFAGKGEISKPTGQKLYFALQAPISEKPAGPMQARVPGADGEQSAGRSL